MIPPVVVLLPGPDVRVLGVSARARNERVAARAGALVLSVEEIADHGERPVILVPPDRLLDLATFPPSSPDTLLDVSTPASRLRSAWFILRRTAKPTDGWVSRHWNRPISRVVSLLLLSLGLKPSHASAITLLVGIGAAWIAAHPGDTALVATAILFQAASVLDGSDGEMARATLTESEAGARLDAVVDQVTYVACFVGVAVGWIREGHGLKALAWTSSISLALILTLVRGTRFVSRYAPDASFVFIDRSLKRAARDTRRAGLRLAPRLFTLMRRDLFAIIFVGVALIGQRALIPGLVGAAVVVANLTFSLYRRELAAAAVAERAS
jgi:phosphatidylglycerophosphate synthase